MVSILYEYVYLCGIYGIRNGKSSAVGILIFGSSNFIVPAMIFIIVAFTAERRFSKKPEVAAK